MHISFVSSFSSARSNHPLFSADVMRLSDLKINGSYLNFAGDPGPAIKNVGMGDLCSIRNKNFDLVPTGLSID